MYVDDVGVDPAKVETSCVLRKLILKMKDGVPYDNFQHALRAEHDWAVVAETLYGCCRRDSSSSRPPCCSAPSHHKLSSPAARWSVMLFTTLLTLMVGTVLIPTVLRTCPCPLLIPTRSHSVRGCVVLGGPNGSMRSLARMLDELSYRLARRQCV